MYFGKQLQVNYVEKCYLCIDTMIGNDYAETQNFLDEIVTVANGKGYNIYVVNNNDKYNINNTT